MPRRLLKLPRRLFGYQPSSVDQLIADRDSMLGAAEQRVRAAEARIAELEEELKRREEDLEAVKRHAPDTPASVTPTPAPQPDLEAVEPEAPPSSEPPTWMSGSEVPYQPPPGAPPPPSPPEASVAEVDDESDGPDEIEEWPVPTVPPRTVEFTPPSEPSAEFDPMPIGGEEGDWSTGHERWGRETEGTNAGPAWGDSLPRQTPEQSDPWGIGDLPESSGWAVEEVSSPPEEAPPPAAADDLQPAPSVAEVPHQPQPERDEPPSEEPSVPPQITPAYMSEELAHVVKAAEESATRIIERAWEATRTQISEVDRLWREVQDEIVRFAAWRQHVDPLITTVQGYIDEARARIDEVPRRIQEALSPAAEAMAAVDAGMSEFAKASDLPQLLGRLHEAARATDTEVPLDLSRETDPADRARFDPPEDMADMGVDQPDQVSEPDHPDGEPDPPRYFAGQEGQGNGGLRVREGDEVDMARAIAHELKFMNESGEPIRAPDNL